MTILVEMISEDGCKDCQVAKAQLVKLALTENAEIRLKTHDISSDKAVDIAIEHNLSTVPSLLIGNIALEGPSFKDSEIINAFRKSNV